MLYRIRVAIDGRSGSLPLYLGIPQRCEEIHRTLRDSVAPEYANLRGCEVAMQDDYVECPELSGKTIQTLRIYMDTGDGTDLQIELTDGTSFTFSLSHQPTVRASLYEGGAGAPKTIRNYGV